MAKTQKSVVESPIREPAQSITEAAVREAAPTLQPDTLEGGTVEGRLTVPSMTPPWYNGKKITALWCNQTDRNAYIYVGGMGWRKLSNANASALLSMVMLASHAEQTNATVNLRVESDNMVHEIYVW
ncbi:MAG: hypothetical protein P8098_11540 [Candidatus Thiodiazotropha sp.]